MWFVRNGRNGIWNRVYFDDGSFTTCGFLFHDYNMDMVIVHDNLTDNLHRCEKWDQIVAEYCGNHPMSSISNIIRSGTPLGFFHVYVLKGPKMHKISIPVSILRDLNWEWQNPPNNTSGVLLEAWGRYRYLIARHVIDDCVRWSHVSVISVVYNNKFPTLFVKSIMQLNNII